MNEEESGLPQKVFILILIDIILGKNIPKREVLKRWEGIWKTEEKIGCGPGLKCLALNRLQEAKRAPENVSAYLIYKISRSTEEKNLGKQKRMHQRIEKGYTFCDLKDDFKKDPFSTFEDIRGAYLTGRDLTKLMGKEIKCSRIQNELTKKEDELEDEWARNL